jgi:hypothetical protein
VVLNWTELICSYLHTFVLLLHIRHEQQVWKTFQ